MPSKKGLIVITYAKQSEIKEKWGIDITVQFTDEDVNVIKTFCFENQAQIESDFDARMVNAIANIDNKIAESKIPESNDIVERIQKHYETNITMSKTEYENYKNTELTRSIND